MVNPDRHKKDSFLILAKESIGAFYADCRRNGVNLRMLLALLSYRISHIASRHRKFNKLANIYAVPVILFHRFLTEWLLGLDLPAATMIGKGLVIDHGYGVVINKNTIIGSDCRIRQGVTIGCKTNNDGTQGPSPRIGDGVEFGAGSIAIGDIVIGDNAVIGAGAVVVKDVPENAIVVGNPARIIQYVGGSDARLPL